ncbi:MAG: DUF1003 domain-containing protein [Synechococcales cyanobacterium C42_A2020_086]|jgi:uncharacterized membrane protein|nr:DUF1003 domain-containing protein [Synechococcales cyanobacterium C42_A2020_086]
MQKHHPRSLEQLHQQRSPIRNPNHEFRKRGTWGDRLALFITQRVGSIQFFLLVVIWTVVWIGWNSLAPKAVRFDPSPDFLLWLFISNVLQIVLMPLIMVGQTLQGKQDEIRTKADYETNVKAEEEIEIILQHLENQNREMEEIKQLLEKLQRSDSV